MTKLNLLVRCIRDEALAIRLYELVDPGGGQLPPFTAGGHVDVEIPGGFVRQYSLCGDPAERRRYLIAVLRADDGGGGSRTLHDMIAAGDTLAVSPPRNSFPIAKDAARHLLLAGGIGVTPMMAMVEQLKRDRAEFVLHYCTRSPERTAFRDRLADLGDRVIYHHDQGDPRQGLDIDALLANRTPGTHLYYCGPSPFMRAVKSATTHWPADSVHSEYFAPDPSAAFSQSAGASFKVRLARRGGVFDVPPDKTIAEVLRAAGVELETSCEVGTCGACKTRFLEGAPQHNDYVLTASEQREWVMVCCARADTELLVLDI